MSRNVSVRHAPTLFTACHALPPKGAVLAWGGPARRTVTPTLFTACHTLPPEGADFPRGGPAGNVPGFNVLTGGGHAATRIIPVYHLCELAVRA